MQANLQENVCETLIGIDTTACKKRLQSHTTLLYLNLRDKP
jgi:hypothetical protein